MTGAADHLGFASMSWLGWIIVAAVLCPLWWKVAAQADKLRRAGGEHLGGLPSAIYSASMMTTIIIALVAIASVMKAAGVMPMETDLGLF